MFESLTDKLSHTFRNLRGKGKLTEENMADALKEVRTALLSADVHFRVARNFINEVKEKCVGQEVTKSVSPGQQVVKIINDELIQLLGGDSPEIPEKKPLRVMMVGLHGSGKTTSSAKMGRWLTANGYRPLLIACDVYRPAAIDQLEQLAAQESLGFYAERDHKKVAKIGKNALQYAKDNGYDALLFDTAGRLQIDKDLIEEVKDLRKTIIPDEVFLVADSALGQEAVNVAQHFHEAVDLTGIILTKLDGDARGGAALSMKAITGVPIRYAGIGEKPEDFERFHPDRMASRILGMGDVVSLVEKAQENIDQQEAEKMAEKMRKADFNLEDFLSQMQQVKKLGSMQSILSHLPGMGNVQIGDEENNKMKRTEAIVLSMTLQERRNPKLLNGSRRNRIAKGSGTKVSDVNQLLKQFTQMKKMMKAMRGGKGKKMMRAMQEKMGGGAGGLPKLPGMGG
ncbi:MAG: signal recognition particle protein [Opitutales bacterium]|nr:signal recognition particle protein [Opitutales bacterium]MCH8539171.1 signal recognition particle protein [Opitutales bacterium]